MPKKPPSMASISRMINKNFGKGQVQIKQILDKLEEIHGVDALHDGIPGTTYTAMQHSIDTDYMFKHLYHSGCIKPVDTTKKQEKILKEWDNSKSDDWDSGDNGRGGEYAILESVKWERVKKKLFKFI